MRSAGSRPSRPSCSESSSSSCSAIGCAARPEPKASLQRWRPRRAPSRRQESGGPPVLPSPPRRRARRLTRTLTPAPTAATTTPSPRATVRPPKPTGDPRPEGTPHRYHRAVRPDRRDDRERRGHDPGRARGDPGDVRLRAVRPRRDAGVHRSPSPSRSRRAGRAGRPWIGHSRWATPSHR